MKFAVIDAVGRGETRKNIKKIQKFFEKLYGTKYVYVAFNPEKLVYEVVVKNEKV